MYWRRLRSRNGGAKVHFVQDIQTEYFVLVV